MIIGERQTGRTYRMIKEAQKVEGKLYVFGINKQSAEILAKRIGGNAIPLTILESDKIKGNKFPIFIDHSLLEYLGL